MMKSLVVYESLFGNTQEVAQAIASGLSEHVDVELREVTKAPPTITEPLDLIVVGGPIHAFSTTRTSTRADATRQGAGQMSLVIGLLEWLEQLPSGRHSQPVATFDIQVSTVRHLPHSEARGAARIVQSLGYPTLAGAEAFHVQDVGGPLVESELGRARGAIGVAQAGPGRVARQVMRPNHEVGATSHSDPSEDVQPAGQNAESRDQVLTLPGPPVDEGEARMEVSLDADPGWFKATVDMTHPQGQPRAIYQRLVPRW